MNFYKRNIRIILFFLSVLILLVIALPNITWAESTGIIESDINAFSSETPELEKTRDLRRIVQNFLGYLRIISGLILIIVIATLGIKFMTAAPNVKTEIKEQGFKVVMALVLIYGAVSIAKFFLGAGGG